MPNFSAPPPPHTHTFRADLGMFGAARVMANTLLYGGGSLGTGQGIFLLPRSLSLTFLHWDKLVYVILDAGETNGWGTVVK